MDKIGVLLMNLGGPERITDVGPFLYNLFSDPEIIRTPFPVFQKPLAWLISTLRSTTSQQAYLSIGGGSPIRRITEQQARELQEAITRQQFAQTEPQQRLNDYLRAITGATRGGVTTSTRPIYSSGGRDSSFLNPVLGAFTLARGLGGLFG